MSHMYVRPDRYALLELDALLEQVERLTSHGDRAQFDKDDHHRWTVHRLWIAVGNEASSYAKAIGRRPNLMEPWGRLYRLRNALAHRRLSDIDEESVWEMVVGSAELRTQARAHLN